MGISAFSSIAAALLLSLSTAIGSDANSPANKLSGREAREIFSKMKSVYQNAKSLSVEGQLQTTTSSIDANDTSAMSMQSTTRFTIRLKRPSLYLVEWSQEAKAAGMTWTVRGAVFNDGTGDWLMMGPRKEQKESREMALAGATGISGGAAATIPALFFGQMWGSIPGIELQKLGDEKVGGEECFVLVDTLKSGRQSTKMWISKKTYLLKRLEQTMGGWSKDDEPFDKDVEGALGSRGNDANAPEAALTRESARMAAEMMAKMRMVTTQTFTRTVVDPNLSESDFVPKDATQLPQEKGTTQGR